jgi:hypothetical protein
MAMTRNKPKRYIPDSLKLIHALSLSGRFRSLIFESRKRPLDNRIQSVVRFIPASTGNIGKEDKYLPQGPHGLEFALIFSVIFLHFTEEQ